MSDFAGQLRLLLMLIGRPGAAMSGILDRGSLLFASAAALGVGLVFGPRVGISFYSPLLILAVVYVPGVLLLAAMLGGLGGFRSVFQRDYSPLLTCAAMSWTIAAPLFFLARYVAAPYSLAAPLIYFAYLMFLAVRTTLGLGDAAAWGTVALSWIPLVGAFFAWAPLSGLLGWLASPFFLFYAYYYLSGEFANLGAGFRQGQSFRRMLEAATVNPHDAEARYQLGLIYQARRQYTEAIERFKQSVAIDPRETDAHFQLGRIALDQGRLKDALGHFQVVVDQDEAHHHHEILRELGRMYFATKQYGEARRELAAYIARREYDPEGLYYYGQALEGLGEGQEARSAYRRSIEAAAAAPYYRRRQAARWSRLAQKQMRKLAG